MVCPEQLQVRDGNVELDDALKGSFMRLQCLELNLRPEPQLVQLADLEESLPTQRVSFPVPDEARVLGFQYWEVGGPGPLSTHADCREDLEARAPKLATLYH